MPYIVLIQACSKVRTTKTISEVISKSIHINAGFSLILKNLMDECYDEISYIY